MRIPYRTLLVAPLLLAACESSDSGGGGHGNPLPATDYLTVETADGLVLTGEVPRITVVEQDGGLPLIEVRGEATDEDGTRLWYFFGRLDEDDLLDGFAEEYRVLGTTADSPGIVNVGIETPDGDMVVARGGTAAFQRFDGWLKGQIGNDDPRMAADLKGGYRISCSYLDPAAPGGGRIVDEAFESAFCSRFAGARPPDPAAP